MLKMRQLLLLCCLAASASAQAEVKERLEYRHYDARAGSGRSLPEILNDSSPFRPGKQVFHSAARWNVDWKFQPSTDNLGRCRVVRVATHLSGEINLPRLLDADALLQDKFSDYLKALRVHELGHYEIGRQAAKALDAKLSAMPAMTSCDALESAARDLGARVLGEYEARGKRYDIATGHGKTQGAWLGD